MKVLTTAARAEFSFLMRWASSMTRYCQGMRARGPFSMTATSYVVTHTCQPRSAAVMPDDAGQGVACAGHQKRPLDLPGCSMALMVSARSSLSPCKRRTPRLGQKRPNSMILGA